MRLPLSAESQQLSFDLSQLEIGINWTLGSVPLSHWDQSQCPVGISPNWTLGSVPVSDWDQSKFGCCDSADNGRSMVAPYGASLL